MLVPLLLLDTLEELYNNDFEAFKWHLTINVLDGCEPIPRSRLESPQRTDTVRRMIESYGEEKAVSVTVGILKMMTNNNAAEKLRNRYAEENTAAASTTTTTSAAAPPAAPAAPPAAPAAPPAAPAAPPAAPVALPAATLLAQQGSVIIAPTVAGGTSGTWNITVNK